VLTTATTFTITRKTHEAAYRCWRNWSAKAPNPRSSMRSWLPDLEAATTHYAYPPNATIEQAMDRHRPFRWRPIARTRTAPRLSEQSPGPNTDEASADAQGLRAQPYDLGMAAAYGYGLIFAQI